MELKYLDLAKKYFPNHPEPRWKFVALLVDKEPISVALNNTEKTHPLISKEFPYKRLHAEIHCLLKAPREKISQSHMYVFRFTKDGNLAISKPCIACMKVIKKFGVKHITYSLNSRKFQTITLSTE